MTIACVDMDCFFAAVEVLDDPSLSGMPVLVGGTGPRSVVAAASYEARRFGARSAQPMSQAISMVPDAIIRPPRIARYREAAMRVRREFESVAEVVEPVSIDEAFLKLSDEIEAANVAARTLRARIEDRLGLRSSVGLAPNKSIAKLASERAKPQVVGGEILPGRGVVVVEEVEVDAFVLSVDLGELHGLGPQTVERCRRMGITTVRDLRKVDPVVLVDLFGEKLGRHLFEAARGIDHRPVRPSEPAVSMSHETTFPGDVWEPAILARTARELAQRVVDAMHQAGVRATTVHLKVRYGDLSSITRSISVHPFDELSVILHELDKLVTEIDRARGVRLIGVGVSGLSRAAMGVQPPLFLVGAEKSPD